MDPYLENPRIWESVHNAAIVYMAAALNASLPQEYIAVVEQWLYVVPTERRIQPDLTIGDTGPLPRLGGGVAVIERPISTSDAPWIVEVPEDRTRQLYVNILRTDDHSQVVATLKLLSYTNKTPGRDRDAYRRKQQAVYASATHLIEIDLLRAGAHSAAVPLERLGDAPYDYLVCLHRGQTGPRFEIWPVTIQQRLPIIAVPLDAGVAEVTLNLQAVFNRCYEEGAYARLVNYSQEPVPPLEGEAAAWADALLRERGLRP
jgi:hypothetical protein